MAGDNMTTNENFEEMYLERLRYLISVDGMFEQMLEDQYDNVNTIQPYQKISLRMSQKSDVSSESELALA